MMDYKGKMFKMEEKKYAWEIERLVLLSLLNVVVIVVKGVQ